MAYTKKTWTDSTVLALADLQHMETQYGAVATDLAAHVISGHPAIYRPSSDMDSYFWHAGNDGDESGLDADTLEGQHASAISGGVASGVMFWWYPENGDVPDGYYFCDGSNGTYDMRNKFPIGASDTLAVGATVGNASITPEASVTIGACTLTPANIHHAHQLYDFRDASLLQDAGGATQGYSTKVTNTAKQTGNAGSGSPHYHNDGDALSTFAGEAASLDPIFQYLVIIQKS